ncbi:MAG: hypothetical protein R8G66_21745 [Cytophagales bacterium]|nr:hypothetical protein [Cytophagales bacterium]
MGEYAEIVHGEIAGLKIGLISNEDDLYAITKSIENEPHQVEYFVGFGFGFNRAQQIRNRLKSPGDLSFDEKTQTVKIFLEKNSYFPKYSDFCTRIDNYVENQGRWNSGSLSPEVCDTTDDLLNNNLLQRALDGIYNYYAGKGALKALLEFENFKERLKSIRKNRRNKEYSESYLNQEMDSIKKDLITWIQTNRN